MGGKGGGGGGGGLRVFSPSLMVFLISISATVKGFFLRLGTYPQRV